MKRKQRRKQSRMGILLLALLLLLGGVLGWLVSEQAHAPAVPSPEGTAQALTVTFLDVGQADAALLRWGDHAALIDAGDTATAETLAVRLVNLGVRKLDVLVATHAHADHIGGMARLLEIFPVETVYWSDVPGEGQLYENLAGAFSDREMTPVSPRPGTVWSREGVTLRFLGPVQTYEEINDSSLVCRIEADGVAFLMTGDMEAPAEEDLLAAGKDLNAQVLKVGHHGSTTSSTEEFLRAVSPELAIISCGKDNSYGLPAQETLDRLEELGIPVLRTDLEGELDFLLEKGNMTRLPPETGETAYIGNSKSYKFHRPDCSGLPAEQNRVTFWTREGAAFAGYAPCGACKP